MAIPFDIPALVGDFRAEFGKSDIRSYAASTAYCMLLSVCPVLLIASSVLPYTSLSQADMVGFLLTVFPESAEGIIRSICSATYQAAGGILPVSIIFLLWSAGFGVLQLTKGLNAINGVSEKRNYFLLRLVATLYTLLMLALTIATLFLQIFIRQLLGLWESAFPFAHVPGFLTSAFRYVVIFAAAVGLFLLLFTVLPATRKNLLGQLPGAIVAAGGWEVLSGLLALYVNFSGNLNAFYGSLTTLVMLMLWIYWCFYLMLFGAFMNRFIELHILPVLGFNGNGGDDEAAPTSGEPGDEPASGHVMGAGKPADVAGQNRPR